MQKIVNGYVFVKVEKDWIKEHVLVVETFLNRKLDKNEVIHHINQQKTDNRIENLMVFSTQKEHAKFHNLIKKFPYLTNPMRRRISERWDNLKVVTKI